MKNFQAFMKILATFSLVFLQGFSVSLMAETEINSNVGTTSNVSSQIDGETTENIAVETEDVTTEVTLENDVANNEATEKVTTNTDNQVVVEPFELIPSSENIITNIILIDSNGNPISVSNPVNTDDAVNIIFDWEIPDGLVIHDGDTYEFDLPPEFLMYNEVSGTLGEYGTFIVDVNGHVIITFNEEAATSDGVFGTIEISTNFNEEVISGSTDQVIEFPIGDGIDVGVNFKPKDGVSIDKIGTIDHPHNGEFVDWSVILNTELNSIGNAKFEDTFPSEMELVDGSIIIHRLNVNVDGTYTVGEVLDPSEYTVVQVDNHFEVIFNENPLINAYKIDYQTQITNSGNLTGDKTFENNAKLTGDDVDETDTSSVTTSYGKPIEKRVTYDPETQSFYWDIRYNFNEGDISQGNAWVEDTFPNSFQIDGDIVVYEVSIDSNGNETISTTPVDSSEYSITTSDNGTETTFKVEFNTEVEKAYVIRYKTTANPDLIIDENGKITNKVETGNGDTTEKDGNYKQHIVDKNLSSINYTTDTVEWHIDINGDEYEMTNVTISDVFSTEALTFVEGSLVVRDMTTNTVLQEGVDYNFITTTNPKGFVITMPYLNHKLGIDYLTKFDVAALEEDPTIVFGNSIDVSWQDTNGNNHNSGDEAHFKPDTSLINNGAKNGKYDPLKKEIEWTIYANSQDHPLVDASIVDQLSLEQKIIPESVSLFHYTILPNGNIVRDSYLDESEYEVIITPATESIGEKIEVKILSDFAGGLATIGMTFRTSLEGFTIHDKYENKAIFSNNGHDFPLTGTVNVPHGDEVVEKKGVQNGNKIDWTLAINYSQSTIDEAVIVDDPSNNQRFDEDSFVIYKTTVNANGDVIINTNETLTEGIDYELVFSPEQADGTQHFTINFLHEISEPYVLKYSSSVDAYHQEQVTNHVSISGKNIVTIEGEDDTTIIYQDSSGSGSGNGHRGSIKVTKMNEEQTRLQGITFELYSIDGVLLRTGVTDINGELYFMEIRSGDYILKEVGTPPGYWIDPDLSQGIVITVDNPNANTEDNVTFQNIINEETEIILTKKNKLGTVIPGATYTIEDRDTGTIVGTDVTNALGQITFKQLPFGWYVIREIDAPDGYLINEKAYEVYLGQEPNQEGEDLEVTVDEFQGSAYLYKTNEDNIPLEGVEFKLYKDGLLYRNNLLTDNTGYLYFNDLPPGDYTVKEVKTLEGLLLPEETYDFQVPEEALGEPIAVNLGQIINYIFPNKITVTKKDSAGELLDGATYTIEEKDTGAVIGTAMTNNQGQIVFENLPFGWYIIREKIAPDGYLLNTKTYEVWLGQVADEREQIVEIDAIDYQGSAYLLKTDESGHPLEGVEFELYGVDDTLLKGGLKTDANGHLYFNDLAPGEYYVKEVSTLEGFMLPKEVFDFEILTEALDEPVAVNIGEIVNHLYPNKITLTKKDDEDKLLAGATYTIEDKVTGVVAKTATTNVDGELSFENLPFGTYIIRETVAPVGYLLNTRTYEVALSEAAGVQNIEVEAIDYQGAAYLLKTDENSKPLVGVEFALYKDDKLLQSNLVTDSTGYLYLNDLGPGKYYLKETKALNGFTLLDNVINFEIAAEALDEPEVIDIGTVINYLAPDSTLTVTGEYINEILLFAITLILFGGIQLIIRRRMIKR